MNTLDLFLKQTIDSFEHLHKEYRIFGYVDKVEIKIYVKKEELISNLDWEMYNETSTLELSRVDLKEVCVKYIEDLCEKLVNLFKSAETFNWLKEKSKEYSSFRVYLYNGILPYEILVDTNNGVFYFECWSKCYQYP